MRYKFLIVFGLLLAAFGSRETAAQQTADTVYNPQVLYNSMPPTYEIVDIDVTGAPNYDSEMVLGVSGLKVGDKVIVRLVLSLERDMDYLHVKDLRAACFEPAKQLSGNRRMAGVSFYQEVKDASMNFFFEFLPRGTHMIDYPLWVNQEGSYQDGIASFQSIYAPAYNAYSQAGRVEVER